MFFISSDLGLDSVIINLTLFPILQKIGIFGELYFLHSDFAFPEKTIKTLKRWPSAISMPGGAKYHKSRFME